MISEIMMVVTLVSIWLSLLMSIITLSGATSFWFKHSQIRADVLPLKRYPMITLVVPAHNEEIVIAQTAKAILELNYPQDKVELLLYADNCTDDTLKEMHRLIAQPRYFGRNVKIINRHGTGGKAGVLNDALKIAHGEYIGVYDADAIPERNALYFLVQKALENPERYVAVFGRNKTRNAQQNFLTRCINQEIVVTQRIQHCGIWHMFKIMQQNRLIALAYNSEAFQQEPETVHDYYFQRLRWAKGNYQVVIHNFRHLFDRSNWRVKLETFYYSCTFFWFNAAIVLSDVIFFANVVTLLLRLVVPSLTVPFTFGESNILIAQLLLFNWLLMINLYVLQISIAMSTQFGQATTSQLWLALASYFTYSQLFIVVSVHAVISVTLDAILHRNGNVWVKTKRFDD